MKIPDSDELPQRCPKYWQLYFARDDAARILSRAIDDHPGFISHPDITHANAILAYSLQRQADHLHNCPVCLKWLESLPDGEIRKDDPDSVIAAAAV